MEELIGNIVNLVCPTKSVETVRQFISAIKQKQQERLARNKEPEAAKLMRTKYKCTNCRNNDQGLFEEDYKHGQVTCKKCGLVIEERKIHDGEWKRQFSGEENPSFHGPAPDPRFSSGHNLRTEIIKGSGQGAGSKVSKKEMMDLKNIQERVEMNLSNMRFGVDVHTTRIGYKDKQKKEVFLIIDDIGGNLQLHDSVLQAAKGYFADYRDAMEQVQQRDAVTAACIILALEEAVDKEENFDSKKRTLDQISSSSSSSSSAAAGAMGQPSVSAFQAIKKKKPKTFEELHRFQCKFCKEAFSNGKDLRFHKKTCPMKPAKASPASPANNLQQQTQKPN